MFLELLNVIFWISIPVIAWSVTFYLIGYKAGIEHTRNRYEGHGR